MTERRENLGLTREEVAKIEIGHTKVAPAVAWALVVLFLATVFAVPIAQHVHEVREAFAAEPATPLWPPGGYLPRCYDIFASIGQAWRVAFAPGGDGQARPPDRSLPARVRQANDHVLLRDIDEYTDALRDESLLSDVLLGPAQRVLSGGLGAGSEQAYLGRDGWLFYRPGVDYVTAPGFLSARHQRARRDARKAWQDEAAPDPLPAIVDFARQLHARGIRLVLLPTPVKVMIHPEQLSSRYADCREVLQNASYGEFRRRLAEEFRAAVRAGGGGGAGGPGGEIVVYDPAEEMLRRKLADPLRRPLYLRTDTHWLPETMDAVAAGLAALIDAEPARPATGEAAGQRGPYREEVTWVTHLGDVASMLQPLARTPLARRLHAGLARGLSAVGLDAAAGAFATDRRELFARETVTLRRVVDAAGRAWQVDPRGDVLLLGDSFSNVYSSAEMGWGSSAGLAERLSFALGRGIDAIVRNDAGAHATRKRLADELRAGRDRLSGKRVVVWQFAVRELAVGHWPRVSLRLGGGASRPARSADAIDLPAGGSLTVTGRIAEVARPPRPGTVAYKNCLMAVHLVDVRDAGGAVRGAQAVVFTWGMRDNKWTPAARLREGREITLRIRPWADVVGRYGRVRRVEPGDVDFDVAEFWCEEIK